MENYKDDDGLIFKKDLAAPRKEKDFGAYVVNELIVKLRNIKISVNEYDCKSFDEFCNIKTKELPAIKRVVTFAEQIATDDAKVMEEVSELRKKAGNGSNVQSAMHSWHQVVRMRKERIQTIIDAGMFTVNSVLKTAKAVMG